MERSLSDRRCRSRSSMRFAVSRSRFRMEFATRWFPFFHDSLISSRTLRSFPPWTAVSRRGSTIPIVITNGLRRNPAQSAVSRRASTIPIVLLMESFSRRHFTTRWFQVFHTWVRLHNFGSVGKIISFFTTSRGCGGHAKNILDQRLVSIFNDFPTR